MMARLPLFTTRDTVAILGLTNSEAVDGLVRAGVLEIATSEGYAAVRAVVAESAPGVVTQADAHAARDERLADACMWAWLCAGSTLARWP